MSSSLTSRVGVPSPDELSLRLSFVTNNLDSSKKFFKNTLEGGTFPRSTDPASNNPRDSPQFIMSLLNSQDVFRRSLQHFETLVNENKGSTEQLAFDFTRVLFTASVISLWSRQASPGNPIQQPVVVAVSTLAKSTKGREVARFIGSHIDGIERDWWNVTNMKLSLPYNQLAFPRKLLLDMAAASSVKHVHEMKLSESMSEAIYGTTDWSRCDQSDKTFAENLSALEETAASDTENRQPTRETLDLMISLRKQLKTVLRSDSSERLTIYWLRCSQHMAGLRLWLEVDKDDTDGCATAAANVLLMYLQPIIPPASDEVLAKLRGDDKAAARVLRDLVSDAINRGDNAHPNHLRRHFLPLDQQRFQPVDIDSLKARLTAKPRPGTPSNSFQKLLEASTKDYTQSPLRPPAPVSQSYTNPMSSSASSSSSSSSPSSLPSWSSSQPIVSRFASRTTARHKKKLATKRTAEDERDEEDDNDSVLSARLSDIQLESVPPSESGISSFTSVPVRSSAPPPPAAAVKAPSLTPKLPGSVNPESSGGRYARLM